MTIDTLGPAAETPLRIVVVGHVDHGKSTMIGRLIHDTGSMPAGRVEALRAMSERRGMPFEWAFLLDALQAERDQGITIDMTQIPFKSARRPYLLIDAPGHKEFLKNMITGAAAADAAILVIDAAEGVREQSRRHGYLLRLMGVRQIAVAVNKMDLVAYGRERFEAVAADCRAYLAGIGVEATHVVPVSSRDGGNIASPSPDMPWYTGATVLTALDSFTPLAAPADLPLRFPVQDVYKFDNRRIVAGRIESGTIAVGDEILISPANKTARVASIETWNTSAPVTTAGTGRSVGITLDEQLFIERGNLISHNDRPPLETDVFRARLFWLGDAPLVAGKRYRFRLNTFETEAWVQSVDGVVDTEDLATRSAAQVGRNEVAEVTIRAERMVALDEHAANPATGRFVLVDGYDVAGGGIIAMDGYADQRHLVTVRATNVARVEHDVTAERRALRNGHKGGVIWLTGMSGAGKSTIAMAAEKRLFAMGYQTYVLDGDNVRHGLNADLGFAPEERAENIRRIGEVAALLARAGLIAITAFISPYRSDRQRARAAAGEDFHEVHIAADLAVCESRDPKGLYRKARAGEIKDFTGIDAPYEAPAGPELIIDTAERSVDECVDILVDHVVRNLANAPLSVAMNQR